MTYIQTILLEMAKEIDLICHNHGIEYYLSGGSVIGALRHKGFIPWDDDIDILMTRQNWRKFLDACKGQLPPNRKLECFELNETFNNTINRYINTDTIDVHKNELLGETTAGIVIDIILLDSIPDGEESYQKYLKDIVLYSDLICLPYIYLLRWRYKVPYRFYLWLTKKVGRKKVSEFFEKRLSQYSELNCNKYVVAWGGGPTLFEKSIFGTPRYVKFEDCQLPIPEKAYEFTRILYGYDVMNLPAKVDQVTHDTIISYDHDYTDFISGMRKVGWNREHAIKNVYLPHKLLAIKWAPRQNADSYRSTLIEAYKVKCGLENRIQRESINVPELFEQGKYDTLRDLFKEYILKQSSRTYVGGETWAQLTRRHDPVFIDISDELLGYILYLLIYDGEMEKMDRILRAREMTKKEPLASPVANAKKFLLQIREAINCYDSGEYERSLSILLSLDQEYPNVAVVSKLKIRIWKYELKTNQKMCNELIQREFERFPEDGEFIKYYADLVYSEKGIGQSWQLHKHAFDQTRNGIFRNEIVDIFTIEMDWMYKIAAQYQEANKWEEAQTILDAWSIIPSVLETDLRYQRIYFNQQMSSCESEQQWQSVRKRVLKLWDAASDKTVLMDVYRQIMVEIGENTSYLNDKIVLAKKSTYQELAYLHENLVQRLALEDNQYLRFLKGVTAYRMGCHGEAFEEFRQLWWEECDIEEVGQILSNDLLHQIVRMNRIKSVAAQKYFAAEWTVKYPNAAETAHILVTLGLCCARRQEEAAATINNIMNHVSYDKAVTKLLKTLCRPKFLEIAEK